MRHQRNSANTHNQKFVLFSLLGHIWTYCCSQFTYNLEFWSVLTAPFSPLRCAIWWNELLQTSVGWAMSLASQWKCCVTSGRVIFTPSPAGCVQSCWEPAHLLLFLSSWINIYFCTTENVWSNVQSQQLVGNCRGEDSEGEEVEVWRESWGGWGWRSAGSI